MKALALIASVFLVAGCETQQLRIVSDEVVQAAVSVNDKTLELSELSLCASPLSAILRRYGNDPDKLASVLNVCGWSTFNTNVLIRVLGKNQ